MRKERQGGQARRRQGLSSEGAVGPVGKSMRCPVMGKHESFERKVKGAYFGF